MILKYGAKNFYCFRDGIEISFELGANCPKSISKNKKVANLLCVKGANGSGKTNALKIISFLRHFCADSFSYKPEQEIPIDSYFHNENPIDLFCEVELNGIQYRYELSTTSKKIISETIYRKKKRYTPILHRDNNELSKCASELGALCAIKLRSNASVISTAHQYELEGIKPIYKFFGSIFTNVVSSGRQEVNIGHNLTSEVYHTDKSLFDFAKTVIKKCDNGITDIQINKRKNEEGKDIYYPIFFHSAKVKNNFLTFYEQSSGTRALFNILPAYHYVIEDGGLLVFDEFDINFHPHILPFLIGIFDDEKINKKNSQMIFTTHNSDIMDYLGRYRTILVNQDESESYAYRLDEIPGDILRNDRPITPAYKSGKLGGVPII